MSGLKKPPENAAPVCPGLTAGTFLQVSFEGTEACRGVFVGMEYGRYLLIKMMPLAAVNLAINKKNHFVIRYVHGGHVYGFRTTLIAIIREPLRLHVFAYPEVIESMNLRGNRRHSCLIKAALNPSPSVRERDFINGVITDISSGGCCFETRGGEGAVLPDMKIGHRVTLRIEYPGSDASHTIGAEVRCCRTDSKKVLLGLRFDADRTDLEHQETLGILKSYLSSLEHES